MPGIGIGIRIGFDKAGESGPDESPPVIASATIPAAGTTLVLLYNEALDESSVPAFGDYALAGTSVAIDAVVSVTGNAVTLGLDGTVAEHENGITLDYIAGVDPVRDIAENEAANLNDYAVTNDSEVDAVAPELVSAVIPADGLSLTLTYDEPLDTGSVPAAGDFALSGTAAGVDSVDVIGSTVVLELDAEVTEDDAVAVDYTPGADPIQDAADNEAAALSGEAVTNNSTVPGGPPPDTDPPGVSARATDTAGAYIDVTLDEPSNTGSVPAIGDFALGGTTQAVLTGGSVAYQSSTVLRVSLASDRRFLAGETILLSYTAGSNPIEDVAENPLPNFSGSAVTNGSTARADLVAITRFTDTTGNYPDQILSTARKWAWGGGGGGTTNVTSGGSGAFAEDAAYVFAAGEAWTMTTGAGGAVAGGTGGDSSIGASCVAKGAVGVTGGTSAGSAGTTIRAGLNGAAVSGNTPGAVSHGSSTAATGTTPGEPNGAFVGGTTTTARVPATGGRCTAAAQGAGAAGLTVQQFLELASASFPNLRSVSVQRSVGTNHTVAVPSGVVGDELVYIVASDGNPTITVSGSSAVFSPQVNGSAISLSGLRLTATGSDPTTVTTSASEEVIVIVLRLQASGACEGTGTTASSGNVNAPAHTPSGGNGNYRCFTVLSRDVSAGSGNITGRPTNYDRSIFVPSRSATGSAPDLCIAWRDANVTGSEDPPAWANANADCCAATFTAAKV